MSTHLRGWAVDVLMGMRAMRKREFTLTQVYKLERLLSKKHPNNKHVRAKIRQQLQVLRDRGYVKFTEPGHYHLIGRTGK